MKLSSLRFFIASALALPLILFGGGTLTHSQSTSSHSSSSHGSATEQTGHCQTVCLPVKTDREKNTQNEEDDIAPQYPVLYIKWYLLPTSMVYMLVLAVLIAGYLRRRPPDLVIASCCLRI